ncbi:MAG: hypothetical protein EOO88_51350 [Pedobacter sp.]|nr:MAG: hypothetical protein EOO88_51350 [Pedobacter sp.]
MQLAWSPNAKKPILAECVILPDLADSNAYKAWMPSVKGKIVMISMAQPTGRPDYNWTEFGTPESVKKMRDERAALTTAWSARLRKTGLSAKNLALALEKAGAAAIMASNWSAGFGVNKIFGANTTKIPTIDVSLEDYGLVYRLAEMGCREIWQFPRSGN